MSAKAAALEVKQTADKVKRSAAKAKTAATKARTVAKKSAKTGDANMVAKAAAAVQAEEDAKDAVAAAVDTQEASAAGYKAASTAFTAASNDYNKVNNVYKAKKTAEIKARKAFIEANKTWSRNMNKQEWGSKDPLCVLIPKGSGDVSECQQKCLKTTPFLCNSLNVVPYIKPSSALFEANIPTQCRYHPNVQGVQEGDRLCYSLDEGRPTDGGAALDFTTDPLDPVFYSTCYKRQPGVANLDFKGNTCGLACLLSESSFMPEWRFHDRCISCADANTNQPANPNASFLPTWKLSSTCSQCS